MIKYKWDDIIDIVYIKNSKNSKRKIIIARDRIIKNFKETLFLYSIPNYVEDINQIRKEEDWTNTEQFYFVEEW